MAFINFDGEQYYIDYSDGAPYEGPPIDPTTGQPQTYDGAPSGPPPQAAPPPSGAGGGTPYHNLDWWSAQGVPNGEIFDATTGQLRPGWRHTATGYERSDQSGPGDGDGDWFDLIGGDLGGGVPQFTGGGGYSTTPRPGGLQDAYTPPEWTETFSPLTGDELNQDPGYQRRLLETQRGLERSAAARGSVLSGGFIGRALPRELGNLASQEYTAANTRKFDQYKQRYQGFLDKAGLGMGARQLNEGAYQNDAQQNLNQYLTRFNTYQSNLTNQRNAAQDVWGRNMDLAGLGLRSRELDRPSGY